MDNKEEMLSHNTRLLVAIAGALSLNCQSCLETLIPAALQYGVEPEEITEVTSMVVELRENAWRFAHDLVTHFLKPQNKEKSMLSCCGPDCSCMPPPDSANPRPTSEKV